jgi:hypothetical protein
VERALAGETVPFDDLPLVMARRGYREDTWWNFSYTPVRDESAAIGTGGSSPPRREWRIEAFRCVTRPHLLRSSQKQQQVQVAVS